LRLRVVGVIAIMMAAAGSLAVSPSSWAMTNLLNRAIEKYAGVESYTVTLRSESSRGVEVIKYYYRKPGYIRMEFETPHRGTVVTYDPEEKKVRVQPFKSLESFVFLFDPSSFIVQSSRGHSVDESDIGTLLKIAAELGKHGSVEESGVEEINGRVTDIVTVTGAGGSTVEKEVNRYVLYLERATGLPVKVESFGLDGKIIERVLMDDLEVNTR